MKQDIDAVGDILYLLFHSFLNPEPRLCKHVKIRFRTLNKSASKQRNMLHTHSFKDRPIHKLKPNPFYFSDFHTSIVIGKLDAKTGEDLRRTVHFSKDELAL